MTFWLKGRNGKHFDYRTMNIFKKMSTKNTEEHTEEELNQQGAVYPVAVT